MTYDESPSTGWEDVYHAMDVPTRHEPGPADDSIDVSRYVEEYQLKHAPVVRAPPGYDRSMDDLRFDPRHSRLSF